MLLFLQLLRRQIRRHPRMFAVTGVFMVIVTALWIIEPLYSAYAIDALLTIRDGAEVSLYRIFGLWALIFCGISIFQAIEKYLFWQLDNLLLLERREELYDHVLHLGIPFHSQQKSGEIIKQIDEGADHLVDLQRHILLELLPSFTIAIIFLVISFTIHPLLACLLIVSLVGYVSIVVIGTKKTAALQYRVNKLWVEAIGRAYDTVTNIFSVVSNAAEYRELTQMRRTHGHAYTEQKKTNFRWALVEGLNFFMLTRIGLVGFGIVLYTQGALTLGQLYFFQFTFFRVLVPFEMLSGILPQWNRKVGKVRLSQDIFETPIPIPTLVTAKKIVDFRGEFVFDNVSFSYPATEKKTVVGNIDTAATPELTTAQNESPAHKERSDNQEKSDDTEEVQVPTGSARPNLIIEDFNLTVRPGEHMAFVGHSGAGKSTLALLLNRFYDVTGGRILIDGVDLRELDPRWWRKQIGLVLQENIMFNDTIGENIRYGRPEASDDEVREAAHRAAAGFIEELPARYGTVIGDRGIRLSGGQRQRVAIARAILKKPDVVVLDEATSALDSTTEKLVQQGIEELVKNRTSFIIAHRLSTVRAVDRIVVLDKGKLVACAPHRELLTISPLYREMVELQSHGMLAEEF